MFNILGEFKPIAEKKPTKVKLHLNHPLYSTESIKEDSKYLRLLKDIAKIGLLETIEVPIKTKISRNVIITKDGKIQIEENTITVKSHTVPTINRKDVSDWIKTKHKYLTKTDPYSKDIINVIKSKLGLELSSDCEHFLTSMLENHFFNLTEKQLYLKQKNRNKKNKYDKYGNRIR